MSKILTPIGTSPNSSISSGIEEHLDYICVGNSYPVVELVIAISQAERRLDLLENRQRLERGSDRVAIVETDGTVGIEGKSRERYLSPLSLTFSYKICARVW